MKLIEFLNHKQGKPKYSKGPQLSAKFGVLLFVFNLALAFATIFILIEQLYTLSIGLLALIALIFSYVMDVRGIQIDRDSRKIREYKVFLWFKMGNWYALDDFEFIHLKRDALVTRYVSVDVRTRIKSESNHYYEVFLVDENNKREIQFSESKNYYKAREVAQKIASSMEIGFKDFVKRNF